MKTTLEIFAFTMLLFIGVVAYLYSFLPSSQPGPEGAAAQHDSIVRLVKGGNTTCTGVIVNAKTIITASHCVLQQTEIGMMIDSTPIEIRLADNKPTNVFAKPYSFRVQLDQALLIGDFRSFKARKYMTNVGQLNKIARYDQVLLSCGYPMGGEFHCNRLYFQELYDFMWATNGLLVPGMSGGPVMLADGTVVAINVAVLHGGSAKYHDTSLISPIYNIDMEFQRSK